MRPSDYITERQYSWARRHGIPIDEAGYTEEINDNLFLPLTKDAADEFPAGPDGEPDENLHAVHSSAVLVANVFFYWRLYGRPGPILAAMGLNLADDQVQDVRFEVRCPIAWPVPPRDRRNPPQLDVLLRYRDPAEPDVIKAIAVESKFREPYGQDQGPFADCYLAPENVGIWKGLDPLQDVAARIHQGETLYRRLKAAQLIKHILGLNGEFQGPPNYELVYLWYPVAGPEAVEHQDEINGFRQLIDACRPPVKFRSIRYDDLINSLARLHGDRHGAYIDYLMERYF